MRDVAFKITPPFGVVVNEMATLATMVDARVNGVNDKHLPDRFSPWRGVRNHLGPVLEFFGFDVVVFRLSLGMRWPETRTCSTFHSSSFVFQDRSRHHGLSLSGPSRESLDVWGIINQSFPNF